MEKSALFYFLPVLLAFMIFKMSKPAEEVAKETVKSVSTNPKPFPTYFFSHGGPTFMYENDDFGNKGAWRTIKKLGQTIKNEWKPDYIIVVSAHWQLTGSNLIEIAVPPAKISSDLEENPLIYDFYGFPDHMYKEELHTKNSRFVSEEIRQELKKNGFSAQLTKRGIDHGVWVPFKVAFSDKTNLDKKALDLPALDLPETALIQVSLTGLEKDFDTHFKLGKVLSHFRENLIWDPVQERHLKGMVICSGMSVHNLRDIGLALRSGKKAMPYAAAFNGLLKTTLVNTPDLLNKLNNIKSENGQLLAKAHPTLEHFVPLVVASGVINHNESEPIKELYNDEQLSLGWGIYQFGEY